MDRQNIIAYVLFCSLIALYPIKLGIEAVKNSIGPTIVVYRGCEFKVVKPHDDLIWSNTLSSSKDVNILQPKDEAAEVCVERTVVWDLEEFCRAGAQCSKASRKYRELNK